VSADRIRRRGLDDDDDYGLGNRPRVAYRRPSAAAEALFTAKKVSTDSIVETSEPAAEESPRTGHVKWFNPRQGFGFVTLADGVDAFLPARVLRGENAPMGSTITVRVAGSPKGLEVTEMVGEVDTSTVTISPSFRKPRRADLGESEWTACGTLLGEDWRGTYGFLKMDDGDRVFVAGSTLGKCGLTAETIIGLKLEVGVARGDRGPAALSVKLLVRPSDLHGDIQGPVPRAESVAGQPLARPRKPRGSSNPQ